MAKYFILSLIVIICLFLSVKCKENNESSRICKSTTIRSIQDFNKLKNCSLIVGYVHIVHMQFTPLALEQVQASNVEEISEYLLVYRVEGLDSLERLFPKLLVIRGVNLLYDQYALVILENRDLQNIGLISLLRVLKGSIRVESNPSLCFAHTINWVAMLGNNTKQYYVMKNNKSPNQCPLCYTYQDELETKEINRHKKCWSLGKYQLFTLDYIGSKKCSKQGGRSNCLTSCSDVNCKHCTNYISDKGCMDNCLPSKYKLAFKRQCVTDCYDYNLIPFGMECVEKCPKHYQELKKNNKVICALNCTGNFVVRELEDLEGFKDCSIINGSLTLELYQLKKSYITHLEQAFLHLNEITGYLKILNSPQIVSLHFFKNLHTIGGLELIENRYSLYVVNNHYLEELWLGKVAIMQGCVYFHLNPRLCFEEIMKLQDNLKECTDITVKDASRNSNGERVACGPNLRSFTANITDYNSTAAVVEVGLVTHDEFMLLVGYTYFYKEAPERNVTKFDGRHGCGNDDWLTDVVVTKRRRHILTNLKPATRYAYFVKSMTILDYSYQGEVVTEINYFQTEPSKPEMVAKIYTHSLSTEEIEVHWWPPRITNGIIEKYILQYEETNETIPSSENHQNKELLCQCPKLDIESKIPTPHVENYYNKEQWLYKDFLSNFIYQKPASLPVIPEKNSTSSLDTTKESNKEGNTEVEKQKDKKADKQTKKSHEIKADPNSKEISKEISEINSAENFVANYTEVFNNTDKSGDELNSTNPDGSLVFSELDDQDIKQQEDGKESYFCTHSYPVCNQSNPNIQDQTENKCIPLERFEGAIEVPSHRHSYLINHLKSEKTYKISVRACVKDLANGCGPAKVILAETVSKSWQTVLDSIKLHRL